MIVFKAIRWKNLLSTGNVFTEVKLNANKTTLIVGENGAGKSTILDAISFALFGKPFRKINKPQLTNTITQKGLTTELEFSIGKTEYKIIRGIKPDLFEVYRNGTLLNQESSKSYDQEILENQILKLNHKTFCQVVVLGSASFVPFMKLTALNRREIVEDLLDLQIFTTMNLLLKEKVADNQQQLLAVTTDIKVNDTSRNMLTEHLQQVQKSAQERVGEKKAAIKEQQKEIDGLEKSLLHKTVAIEVLKDKIEPLDALADKLTKLNNFAVQMKTKIGSTEKTVDFFESHDNCPTCKQAIDNKFRETTIKTKRGNIDELNAGLKKLADERKKIVGKYDELAKHKDTINDLLLESNQLKQSITLKRSMISELEKDIKSLNKSQSQFDTTKLEEIERVGKELSVKYNDLSKERDVLNAAARMLKDGGIKSKIVKQYVPIINKLINKYLSAMDFFVQFELNENFEETIKSRFRDEFSYASFSEGEKMRINLAILFTWRAVAKLRNSASTNLLVMDEVLDSSMDLNGTEEFLKLIQTLTPDTNTFVISHKVDQLYDKFEKVVKFEKHKNFSRIV